MSPLLLLAALLRALTQPFRGAPARCPGHPAIDTAYRDLRGVWRCHHCLLPIEDPPS